MDINVGGEFNSDLLSGSIPKTTNRTFALFSQWADLQQALFSIIRTP